MSLRDRCRCQGLLVELREHLRDGLAVRLLDDLPCDGAVERRHAILQLHQLVGDIVRQQIAPGRHCLPELHEDRTQLLERKPQALGAARAPAPFEPHAGRQIEEEAQRPI
jgi:hypothetical protein